MFLQSYLLFLAKLATLVLPLLFVARAIGRAAGRRAAAGKDPAPASSTLRIGDYSALLAANARALAEAMTARGLSTSAGDAIATAPRQTAFVLTIADEALAGRLGALKLEVSAIVQAAHPGDLVVVRIKNRGGAVEAFGSAAAQIDRLRRAGLRIVASIDELATSGGYLVATMADEIIATPFACVGSVGLISTQLNVSGLLERFGVRNEVVTAGCHKQAMNAFTPTSGSVLESQEAYLRGGLEIWRRLVAERRPDVDLEATCSGRIWFAADALPLGLVDRLQSFDEFVLDQRGRYCFLSVGTQAAKPAGHWKNRLAQLMQRFL